MQILSYKYRVLPTRTQHQALAAILEEQRQLYNAALQERIEAWRMRKVARSYIDQSKALTECRQSLPEMAALPANLQRGTLKRVDGAFAGFFARRKRGDKGGYPRFRGLGRMKSFSFSEFSGITLDKRRLSFKGLPGSLRVHLHRPLPDAKILGCTFRRDVKGWSVSFQVRVDTPPAKAGTKTVGLDLGITDLATLSDGTVIPNVRPARRRAREIKLRQRALARCKRGSKRRVKAKERLARLHAKIANARETYLHQHSEALVRAYDCVAMEKLAIKSMSTAAPGKTGLNRSIADAAWAKFQFMIRYKAERAGCAIIEVDPRYTSQTCAECGHRSRANRDRKRFCCTACGHTVDADKNAAINIARRAVVGPADVNVGENAVRRPRNIITNVQ